MIIRRTLATLAIAAAVAGATASGAPAGVHEGMTKAEYRALHIRSEALGKRYGDAETMLSPDVLNALAVRSEGLNRYGETRPVSTPVAPAAASTPFAWDDFAVGMATAFGLLLLTGGLAVAVRTGTRRRVRIPS
jgi:hypothetical protein